MGIPLVWEPPANRDEANNSTSKTEPASGRRHRSSIRRSNYGRPQRPGRAPMIPVRLPSPFSREESQSREPGERDTTRNARNPSDLPPPPPPADFGEWRPLSPSSTGWSSQEVGRRLLRDSLHYSSPGRRLRIRREPSLRLDMAPPSFHNSRDGQQPRPAAPGQLRGPHRVSFSPRFAPAHLHEDEASSFTRNPTPPNHQLPDDRPDVDMPLLRRVGHRSVADATDRLNPHQLIDGLGDRERSFGPEDAPDEDDEEMHDTWETLLTTIQPDEQLPSAGSSFASATATASSALSRGSGLTNSMNSSQPTAPSSFTSLSSRMPDLNPFPEYTANCDFGSSSDGSDTEAESDHELGTHRPVSRNRQRRADQSRTPNPVNERAQPSQAQPHGAEQPTSTNTSFSGDNLSAELQQMHAILDRLARIDDIPDEWWETAGLARIIRRELNNDDNNSGGSSARGTEGT